MHFETKQLGIICKLTRLTNYNKFLEIHQVDYTIWLFNIAMENPHF